MPCKLQRQRGKAPGGQLKPEKIGLIVLRSTRLQCVEGTMKQFCLGVIVAIGLTLPAFGQQAVNPEEGVYVLNAAKSTFRGPAIKTQTINTGNETTTAVGFLADGKPFSDTFPNPNNTADGQSRPATGSSNFDAQTSTRLDPYTVKAVRTKDGKVTQTLIGIYNQDGKTLTVTSIGITPAGVAFNHVLVFDKQ
jgi:hypothetical protein